jgi:uncharacterized membrane protein YkvA (DUF1232 family)
MNAWKACATQLRTELYALYLAYRDPRTPWYARIAAAVVVGYAFSPIDLIPDFIPVLGYLDDLLLLPVGVLLALKLIPAAVMQESREKAREAAAQGKPVNKIAAVVIIGIWILLTALCLALVYRWLT